MSKMIGVIKKIVKKTDICLDVGGGVGEISKILHDKAKFVFIAEPNPDNYNAIVNKLGGIESEKHKLLYYGLSNTNRTRNLYLNLGNRLDNRLFKTDGFEKKSIEVKRGDDIFRNEKFDFIKVDTQGHEIHVLEGFGDLIDNVRNMIVELWPYGLEKQKKKPEDLLHFINSCGFGYRLIWKGKIHDIESINEFDKFVKEIRINKRHADIWASKEYF